MPELRVADLVRSGRRAVTSGALRPGPAAGPGACYTVASRGILLRVRAKPGAREDRVLGLRAGEMLVSTRAAPEKGRANEGITRVIAGALGLRRDEVLLEHGAGAPHKTFALPAKALGALEHLVKEMGP